MPLLIILSLVCEYKQGVGNVLLETEVIFLFASARQAYMIRWDVTRVLGTCEVVSVQKGCNWPCVSREQ